MYNEMKKILFDEKGSRVLVMKNEDGEEVVSVVMIQQYIRNSSGNATYNATTLIDSFNK